MKYKKGEKIVDCERERVRFYCESARHLSVFHTHIVCTIKSSSPDVGEGE